MRVVERAAYVGPNLYASFPVMRMRLDLGVLEEWPSVRLGTSFTDGLLRALPGLQEHGCSYRTPGGFVRRLTEDEGTWMGHILEHVAIELQVRAGEKVTFGKTRSTGTPGEYDVVYAYKDRRVGREAGDLRAHTAVVTPARRSPIGRIRARRFRLGRRTRAVHQVRATDEPRPEHSVACPCRQRPGHPVDPPERVLPGPVRSRTSPAKNPGNHHLEHVAHRGRDRVRQGRDEPVVVGARAARAATAIGVRSIGRRSSRQPHRLSRRGETAEREPRRRREHWNGLGRRRAECVPGCP